MTPPLQLDFLAPSVTFYRPDMGHEFARPEPQTLEEEIIDAALHHVEKQSVLRHLMNGESWSAAFGEGGRNSPVSWYGKANGILIEHSDGETTLIKHAQILARARQYVCVEKKPEKVKKERDPNRPF